MPRREDPFEERPEDEQEQEDGWYFDLPSDAWERTRQVHRQLREQLLQGEGRRHEQVERDPFTGLPIEQPKGLLGRFRRRKPRLPEELERELKSRERRKQGKHREDDGDWSTEGRALAIERIREEAPLIVRPSAPPPPPPEPEEGTGPASRWEQIFGGLEESESPLEAMRRWARGESLRPADEARSSDEEPPEEREAPPEAAATGDDEAEEDDPIIEFMSHELARRARARWEEEHPNEPLAIVHEPEPVAAPQEEVQPPEAPATEVEPSAEDAEESPPPARQMRWEDAFGGAIEDTEGLEAMRRWARGEPLAHGAGWERFERPRQEEPEPAPPGPRDVRRPGADRRGGFFGRLFVRSRGAEGAPADVAAPTPREPADVVEPHEVAERADASSWIAEEQPPAVHDDVPAAVTEAVTELEWQTDAATIPTGTSDTPAAADEDAETWSWEPEPVTPEPAAPASAAEAPLPAEAGTGGWEAWSFDEQESPWTSTAPTAHAPADIEEPAAEAAEPSATPRWDETTADVTGSATAAWEEPAAAESQAPAPAWGQATDPVSAWEAPAQESAPAGEDATAASWWDTFEADEAAAPAAPSVDEPSPLWNELVPSTSSGEAEGEQGLHEHGDAASDDLLRAWDQIAADTGVDPAAPPPPPIRSSALRRPSPWDIAARPASGEPKAEEQPAEPPPSQAREEEPPTRDEPLWVPVTEAKTPSGDEDIILKAFEEHAAAAPDEPEAIPEPVPEGRRRLSLRDLLGDDADDLVAAADEADEPASFAQTHGWMPQAPVGRAEQEVWTPAPFPPVSGDVPAAAPAATEHGDAEPVPHRRVNWVREVVEIGLMAVLLFLCIRATFQNFQVDGTSMYPTLVDGEFLLVNKLAYQTIDLERLSTFLPFIDPGDDGKVYVFGPPQRGDIIVFRDPTNPSVDLIKRIIALPGEKVEITNGKVYINDQLLEEPYIQGQWLGDRPAAIVPEGHYFVLGDNRDNSKDSRSPQIGYVPEDLIIGKAIITLWPRERFGLAPNDGGRLVNESPPAENTRRVD